MIYLETTLSTMRSICVRARCLQTPIHSADIVAISVCNGLQAHSTLSVKMDVNIFSVIISHIRESLILLNSSMFKISWYHRIFPWTHGRKRSCTLKHFYVDDAKCNKYGGPCYLRSGYKFSAGRRILSTDRLKNNTLYEVLVHPAYLSPKTLR
jgi:hypothetical protein